ncbi:glycine cleavage system H protein [Haematococcus lacustris]|uniref:Glycine cleavage system H protein n=1 Tax=Haematococcus lacustris TaxID=44745 RepID=A0A6A0ADL6_HAELA|nr:glycine cleavage system H protein [Haematococcus lacustris]
MAQSARSLILTFAGLRPFARSELLPASVVLGARSFAKVIEGYKYAKSHEWAKVDGGVATVGISDHAQAELGDVVYVELPDVGKEVKQGETFGVVESAASDVYSPVSGEVVEVNTLLADKPATVNADPYTSGWIIKVKLSDTSNLSTLMDSAAYQAVCDEAH